MIAQPSGTEMLICAQFLRILTKVTTTISTTSAKSGTEEEQTGLASKQQIQIEVAKMALRQMTEF